MTEQEIKLSKDDDAYFAIQEIIMELNAEDEVSKHWIIEQPEKAQKIILNDTEE